jgi:hypothetical protein
MRKDEGRGAIRGPLFVHRLPIRYSGMAPEFRLIDEAAITMRGDLIFYA